VTRASGRGAGMWRLQGRICMVPADKRPAAVTVYSRTGRSALLSALGCRGGTTAPSFGPARAPPRRPSKRRGRRRCGSGARRAPCRAAPRRSPGRRQSRRRGRAARGRPAGGMRPPVKSTSSMPEESSTKRLGGGTAAATSSRTRSRKAGGVGEVQRRIQAVGHHAGHGLGVGAFLERPPQRSLPGTRPSSASRGRALRQVR